MTKENCIFTPDVPNDRPTIVIENKEITDFAAKIHASDASPEALARGKAFADEITARYVGDFERAGVDQMVHVTTFMLIDGMIYMTYYANTANTAENPLYQTARLAIRPKDNPEQLTILDIQSAGDECGGRPVEMVYDTIMARTDEDTLMVLWTAKVGGNYYRLCRPYSISEGKLGGISVNRLKVGDVTNDFSTTGISSALAANGIGYRKMFSDIGIMQKFTYRMENGEKWYYTGAYSGYMTMLIKSRDFVTWEYVSQPDFDCMSHWENTVTVFAGKIWYFTRQQPETPYGFLTYYDPETDTWAKPVLIEDCQSRSDFIIWQDKLYLFYAPIDREHIGLVRINTDDPAKSEIMMQAKMDTSCFYPFVQYFGEGLAMSYTVARQHVRLAEFSMEKYID